MSEGIALAAITGMISALIWLVRLEGCVRGHDREHMEHSKRHDEMRADLAYVRARIDQALNGRH